MDLSGTSWISEMGLEDPNLSEQYDILDFFDEELSAAIANIGGIEDQQQDMQNTWSQDFNSSSSNTMLIPRTDSTTSICTSSFFLDSQNIVASAASTASAAAGLEETPFAPQYCHINFIDNNLNGENNNHHHVTPSPSVLVFGNSNKTPQTTAEELLISSSGSYVNLEELAAKKAQSTTKKTPRTRPPSQTYDHIIAERKRRELLSQQFVALSAIVPGLKKMDKTSVLGDAINYLKELKEKVNTLEEKTSKQKMESMVLVKKTQVMIDDDDDDDDDENSNSNSKSNSKPKPNSNSNSDEGSYDEQQLPEIEAKMCDKKLLIRIQCEKNRGVLGKIFTEIQKLNMAVINTNATPFGNMALDITIVAQVDKEFNVTMKELVRSLRSVILLE